VERRAQALAQQLGFKHSRRGYSVAACSKLCLQWYRQSVGGDELRDDKRRREIARLDILIARDTESLEQERIETAKAKAAVMPIEQHTAHMLRLCELFTSGLSCFQQRIGAETRDPKFMRLVTDHIHRLRTELAEQAKAISIP
jgi:hypothetical protein